MVLIDFVANLWTPLVDHPCGPPCGPLLWTPSIWLKIIIILDGEFKNHNLLECQDFTRSSHHGFMGGWETSLIRIDMSLYVCVYVCMCVCVGVYVCLCVNVSVYVYACIWVYMCVSVYLC